MGVERVLRCMKKRTHLPIRVVVNIFLVELDKLSRKVVFLLVNDCKKSWSCKLNKEKYFQKIPFLVARLYLI